MVILVEYLAMNVITVHREPSPSEVVEEGLLQSNGGGAVCMIAPHNSIRHICIRHTIADQRTGATSGVRYAQTDRRRRRRSDDLLYMSIAR